MNINPETGLLSPCLYVNSPNHDARPADVKINLIVLHSISLPPGEYGNPDIALFFQNKLDKNKHPYYLQIIHMQVSAHILIKRDGEIIQFVSFNRRAWHAGKSTYCGRENCNNFSIGIELEGTDTSTFEQAQYQQLAFIIANLKNAYPDIANNITRHSDICPRRKTDPGTGFDINRLHQLIKKIKV